MSYKNKKEVAVFVNHKNLHNIKIKLNLKILL